MSHVNEFTPLLVNDNDKIQSCPPHRRNVWQFVLAGALSLGVLSVFQQQNSVPLDTADVNVSFNEVEAVADGASDVAFLSNTESFKDPSVDPCVDFYEYACGGWLKSHDVPSDRSSIDSSFYVVSENNKATIQQIFDRNPPQIGPFYHSCLSDEEVDVNASAFVTQLVSNIHQANSTLALMELAGEMDQTLGISTFFSLEVGADPQDPTTNVLKLSQGGLTLPSREYYLKQSKVDAYAALYVDYVTKLFAVGQLDHDNVTEFAEAVLEIERAFANISLSNVALRDEGTTNTAYPFAEIAQRYPFVMAYLNGMYKKESFPMLVAILATPDFFEAQNQILSDEARLPQLKKYLSFHLIDSFGTFLGEYFRRVSHDFHGKVQGAGNLVPRNQYCMQVTTAFLGDEVGKYYMQEVFGPDAKSAAESLVAEIEESLKALLLTEKWLDKATYDAAVEKLNKVKNYIGGPDDVPPLPFELQADAFFDNVKRLLQLGAAEAIQSIGKPVDEKVWNIFASTVNAYYDPSANKMVFPAAILQRPFYSAEHFPAAANFARIGMVMGHELSHGFDDQGRNYDGNGALRSWWTPSVSAQFAEKTQCLAAQYSAFPVVSIQDGRVLGNVNGNLTLGENIADNGGIRLAYEAYHLWKSTFAPPPIVPSSEIPLETTNPNPAAVSPPDEQAPKPAPSVPSDEKPAAPVVPIPALAPIETGPDKPIPVETLPPPVVSVPEAETPEAPQIGPDGEMPGASPPQPIVVPEPQPADIPQEITPAPELPTPAEKIPAPPEQESATEAPTVMPDSSTPPPHLPDTPPKLPDLPVTPSPPNDSTPSTLPNLPATPPTLPDLPDTPSPPTGSTPLTPPVVPDTPSPSNTPTPAEIPIVVPPPEPSVVSPDTISKHKHKKEEDEPSAELEKKDHTEKKKRHEGGEKNKNSGKPGLSERDDNSHSSHKHSSEEHGDNEREKEKSHDSKHNHHKYGDNSKEDKSSKKKHLKSHGKHDGHADHDERYSHEDEKECVDCGQKEYKEYKGHHYKHKEDKHKARHKCGKVDAGCGSEQHKLTLSESKYPFSGGDAKIQSMVKKLARAFAQPNDPVSDDRLFFTAFAQNWCEKRTPGYAELLRTTDPHSPGKWRVNGPLMNYAKFAEVFSCPVGTPMNPAKKCIIW